MVKNRLLLFLLVLSLGITASFVNNAPFFLMPYYQQLNPEKNNYHPFQTTYTPLPIGGANSLNYDLALFATMAQKISVHGYKLLFSDIYLKEHINDAYIEGALPYNFLAFVIRVLDGKTDLAWQIVNFLFTVLCYLFIFILARTFGLPDWIAIVLPLTIIFSADPRVFLRADGMYPLKDFNRFPKISFSFLLLCSYLIFSYRFLTTRSFKWALAVAAILVLCLYDYIYYWTTLIGATGMLMFYFIPNRHRIAAGYGIILLITILCATPLMINIHGFITNSNYSFLKESKDQVIAGIGIPPTFALAIVSLGLIALLKKNRKATNDLVAITGPLLAIYLSCFILMHAWVFKLPQMTRYHYSTTIMRPLLLVVLALLFYECLILFETHLPKFKKVLRIFAYCSVLAAFVMTFRFGALNNWRYAKTNYPSFTYDRQVIEGLDWLNRNSSKEHVALTNSAEINFLTALKTHLYQYIPGFHLSMAGFDERWDRILSAYDIFNVEDSALQSFMSEENAIEKYWGASTIARNRIPDLTIFERAFFLCQPFHNYYYFYESNTSESRLRADITLDELQKYNGNPGSYLPLIHRQRVAEKFKKMRAMAPQEVLRKYNLDFIVLYKDANQISRTINSKYSPFIKEVFTNDRLAIYHLERSKL